MKILAKYYGRVNLLGPPTELSVVMLHELGTSKIEDKSFPTDNLVRQNIDYEGCQFELVLEQTDDNKVVSKFRKLSPEEVDENYFNNIKKELPEENWDI